ncbi:MAG: phage tail tape measure protein [Caulobacterales bacterium]|nr:phage tail tape measure protein [Caulobacterales bacterium]
MTDFSDRDEDAADGDLQRGADALGALTDDAITSAQRIEEVFEQTAAAIRGSLEQAARDGELSFRRLAQAALQAFADAALEQIITGPFQNALASAFSSAPFLGGRADGGPVTPGGAFLVGERGPELFTPRQAGDISPVGGAVTVNINLASGEGAQSLSRSRGQIASAVARAVARGRRNL